MINGTAVWDGSTAGTGYTLTGIATGEIEPGDVFAITGPNGNVKVGNTVIIYDLDSGKQIWTATIHY